MRQANTGAPVTNFDLEGRALSRPGLMGRHRGRPSKLASAFTLIELLVVITIIAVLVSIAYPVYNGVQERARAAQDMSNLRQIGLATQMYMNDNDGVIFSSTAGSWMSQLEPKYVPAWKIFESPFDKRTPSELGDATTPVSYGLNGNNKSGSSIAGLLSDKIANPSAFILFAPAQKRGTTVAFQGSPTGFAAGVTVWKATTSPGGNAAGGTHSSRARINAVFADIHTESLTWTKFINDSTNDTSDPDAKYRWDPYQPYP
jgi:prepilin-type N-terminal cleavage/methylation domain-containing protein